ncbi:MAG: YdcF family protein [Bacteroidetes bacterium]|nr:YdcF family protein [Bacteroidota bacterium]
MFFALSKLFSFFIKPLNVLVILVVAGLLTRREHRRKRLWRWAALGLVFFSNPFVINYLAKKWETACYSPDQIKYPYDVGIVLGGYTRVNERIPAGQISFSRADRLTTALQLYKTGKIRHILLSGGSGKLIGQELAEAPVVRVYLLQVGVPDSAIWVDDRSRNTRENAAFSKEIIEQRLPGATCLLITSAWHMRRAHPTFEQAGLHCAPFGTDFLAETSEGNPIKWLEPSWYALLKWELLIKEWIGYGLYSLH